MCSGALRLDNASHFVEELANREVSPCRALSCAAGVPGAKKPADSPKPGGLLEHWNQCGVFPLIVYYCALHDGDADKAADAKRWRNYELRYVAFSMKHSGSSPELIGETLKAASAKPDINYAEVCPMFCEATKGTHKICIAYFSSGGSKF